MAKTNKFNMEADEMDYFEKSIMYLFLSNQFVTTTFVTESYRNKGMSHHRITWFKKLQSLVERGYLKKLVSTDPKRRGGKSEYILTDKGQKYMEKLDKECEKIYEANNG